MQRYKLVLSFFVVLLLMSVMVASAQDTTTIVVWDFKSGDPNQQPYFQAVEEGFEALYPDVDVEFVPQPVDQYYSIIGTAIATGEGPDVMLFNGGALIQDRIDALLPLDEAVADIYDDRTGWDAFSVDGVAYGVPITVQGFVYYYNRAIYADAGLDPDVPPTTWEELASNCEIIVAETDTDCFALGNSEGIGLDFFFTMVAPGIFSPEEYDAFVAGEMSWDDPKIAQIFNLWVEVQENGWNQAGANSTAMFVDMFDHFSRGDAAHTMGLISDIAHWRDFEDFLGVDNVGVFLPVQVNDEGSNQIIPADGGIGFGVAEWTEHPELAIELVKYTTDAVPMLIFLEEVGAIVSNTALDTSEIGSPNLDQIVEWLGCCTLPATHATIDIEVLEEFHRQGQAMLAGDGTADDAIEALLDIQSQQD